MGYEYVLLAAAIILPLGLFSILKGDPSDPASFATQKSKLPGAFTDGSNTSKSKKKKNKKKNKSNVNGVAEASDDSEADEKSVASVAVTTATKSESQTVISKKNKKGKGGSGGDNKETAFVPSQSTAAPTSLTSTTSNNKANNNNNTKNSSKSTTSAATSSSPTSAPLTSIEKFKLQKEEEKKQQRLELAKQQEPLKFAQAASHNAHQSSSSPNIVSIPGPGAMGNNKKKNRSGAAGSGLSHADFPSLARAEPAKPVATKEPKAPKQKKQKEPVKPAVVVPAPPEVIEESSEDEDEDEKVPSEHEQEVEHVESESEEEDKEEEEDEWTTVPGSAAPARSGGIDFNKPMDPWVAQQQKQKLERLQAADPHGEVTTQFARVLSIKPTVKEQAIREAVPDGFSVQKSRSGGSSSAGSRQYQSEEISKKQRENLAKAAKRKEEKAAQDALQAERLKAHMRQVKAEKMKDSYKAQTRKQAPVESRWTVNKQPQQPSSSTVSGGMSAGVNEKG
ncbi:hypothetical protein BGZ94_003636, partial [Podila epigama]